MSARRTTLRAAWDFALVLFGFALLGIICVTWSVPAFVLYFAMPAEAGRRLGRRAAMFWFRLFLGSMEAIGALRLDLRALDSLRGAGALIVAPNHPCLLDAVLVISRLPDAVCVMKGALLDNFLLGPAARLARYVRNDSLLRLASSAGGELRGGGQLLLFPEGTRSTAQPIGPFTEAVGAIARRAGVPVQAVIIEADPVFLGKGWRLGQVPVLPLTYRARLGRRLEPPTDVRAFTATLEQHFRRELAREAAAGEAVAAQPMAEPPRAHG